MVGESESERVGGVRQLANLTRTSFKSSVVQISRSDLVNKVSQCSIIALPLSGLLLPARIVVVRIVVVRLVVVRFVGQAVLAQALVCSL